MTGQTNGTQDAALAALSDLVDVARNHRIVAELDDRQAWVSNWSSIEAHLDAVRTTLVQEGEDYLPVAWAFVDSGRLTIARYMVRIGRRTHR